MRPKLTANAERSEPFISIILVENYKPVYIICLKNNKILSIELHSDCHVCDKVRGIQLHEVREDPKQNIERDNIYIYWYI